MSTYNYATSLFAPALLRAALDAFDRSTLESSMPTLADLLHLNGHIHGGVVSHVADNAFTFAGGPARGTALVA